MFHTSIAGTHFLFFFFFFAKPWIAANRRTARGANCNVGNKWHTVLKRVLSRATAVQRFSWRVVNGNGSFRQRKRLKHVTSTLNVGSFLFSNSASFCCPWVECKLFSEKYSHHQRNYLFVLVNINYTATMFRRKVCNLQAIRDIRMQFKFKYC
jgi:hypothetical protein